jgi:hypothetical protein
MEFEVTIAILYLKDERRTKSVNRSASEAKELLMSF